MKDSVVVKIGKESKEIVERDLSKHLKEYADKKHKKKILDDEIACLQRKIAPYANEKLKDLDTQTITFIIDKKEVKVSFGVDVSIKDVEALRGLLGSRFDDLVKTEIRYSPLTKLKEESLDNNKYLDVLEVKDKKPSFSVKGV